MNSRRFLLPLALALTLVATIAAPAFAQSASDCASRVTDGAGILGANKAAIDAAASRLETTAQGTVRVLVVNSTNGNAAAFRQNTLNVQCKNDWGDGSGIAGKDHSRSDLLAVIVGMDKQDDVYAAPRWDNVFQKQVSGQPNGTLEIGYVRTNFLESALKGYTPGNSKPIADGITAALNRMQTDIAAAAPTKPAAAAAAPVAQPARPAAPAQNGPNTGLILIGLIALVLLCLGGWYVTRSVIRSRREARNEDDARTSAQQDAIAAKSEAIENVNSLDDKSGKVRVAIDLLSGVPANTLSALEDSFTAAKGKADAVARRFGSIGSGKDPSVAGQGMTVYQSIQSTFNALNREAIAAHAALDAVLSQAQRLKTNPNATVQPVAPTPPPPAPPPVTPQPPAAASVAASMPAAPPTSFVGASSPTYSNGTTEADMANRDYDAARSEVIRAERFILDPSNVYYVRQSTWDDFRDAKRELGEAERSFMGSSKSRHSQSAGRRAQNALRDAERDVRMREDQRRHSWFRTYYGGYQPYYENNTFVVIHDDYGYRDSGSREPASASGRSSGSESSGSWGTGSGSSGSESSGSWGSGSGSSGSESSGSWGSGSGSSGSDSSGGYDSGSSSGGSDSGSSGGDSGSSSSD